MYIEKDKNINDKRSLSIVVTDNLRKRLLSGSITSGEKLREGLLADELCVSRSMIREAFIRLEIEGLIEKGVNTSAIVKKFDEKDVKDVYEYRRILENAAARKIIDEGIDVVSVLENDYKLMNDREVIKNYTYMDSIKLDLAFHRKIVENCGNDRILKSWDILYGQLLIILYAIAKEKYNENQEYETDMLQTHYPILKAFKEGDKDALCKIMDGHIGQGYEVESASLKDTLKNI